jgi:DNA-binding LacI/PurR family transcriptional regulator
MAVIKDVAQLAGLSVSVVSKYLNYPDNVSEDTKLRVEAAIKELNYAPSLTARSMRTKRSQMIAIIVPDIMDAFYTDVFNSVKQYALAKGYTPILYTIENDIELLKDYLAKVSTKLFDGLMLCFLEEDELLEMYDELQAELPVVMLSGAAADNRFSAVITDLFEGSYIATKHLISSGCKRIACICGPKGRKTTDEKKAGYAKAVKEAGLEVMEEYLYYGPYRYQTGYEAGVKFFRLPKTQGGSAFRSFPAASSSQVPSCSDVCPPRICLLWHSVHAILPVLGVTGRRKTVLSLGGRPRGGPFR